MQKFRAFVSMAEEDFGIAPLEAQSAGVLVIDKGKRRVFEPLELHVLVERLA